MHNIIMKAFVKNNIQFIRTFLKIFNSNNEGEIAQINITLYSLW